MGTGMDVLFAFIIVKQKNLLTKVDYDKKIKFNGMPC